MSTSSIALPQRFAWPRQLTMVIAGLAVALVIALAVLAFHPEHASHATTRSIPKTTPYAGSVNSSADNPSDARFGGRPVSKPSAVSLDCITLTASTHAC
jgi:hypothetical protein